MSHISFRRFRQARDFALITLLQYTPYLSGKNMEHTECCIWMTISLSLFHLGQSDGALGSSNDVFSVLFAFHRCRRDLHLDANWFTGTLVVAGSKYNSIVVLLMTSCLSVPENGSLA